MSSCWACYQPIHPRRGCACALDARRVEVTPDQVHTGAHLLARAVSRASQVLSVASTREQRLTAAARARRLLAAQLEAIPDLERDGPIAQLAGLAWRLATEPCSCAPLIKSRRRRGLAPPPTWCTACHARLLLGRDNP